VFDPPAAGAFGEVRMCPLNVPVLSFPQLPSLSTLDDGVGARPRGVRPHCVSDAGRCTETAN